MLNRLRQLTDRIPLPVRTYWKRYGVYAVLLLSGLGFWLGHGERYVNLYLESTPTLDAYTQHRLRSTGYRFGYTAAYVALRFVYAPQQALPWLGLLWGLAVINYRFFMRRLVFQGRWFGLIGYPLLATTVLVGACEALLRFAIGKNQVNATIAWWVVGWCVAYGVWTYLRSINKTRRALTETGTQAELTALKAQVNPHFLFNSLNNIFGTALTEGGQRTPDGVQQLSRLIRYQLEQTQTKLVTIDSELRFVDEYVQFHQQFLPNQQAITFNYEWDQQPATLPPLLLTPLIDHALQQAGHAPIVGNVNVRQQRLHLQLTYPVTLSVTESEAMLNLRQRLMLLFPDRYTLNEQLADKHVTTDLILALTD